MLLAMVTAIGSFGEFDNRAQAGGAVIGAVAFGVIGVILLVLGSRSARDR